MKWIIITLLFFNSIAKGNVLNTLDSCKTHNFKNIENVLSECFGEQWLNEFRNKKESRIVIVLSLDTTGNIIEAKHGLTQNIDQSQFDLFIKKYITHVFCISLNSESFEHYNNRITYTVNYWPSKNGLD